MKILRVAAAAAGLLALFLQTISVQAQTKWTQIQPPGAGFRIEFPGKPAIKKDTLPSRVGPAPHLEAKLTHATGQYSVELTEYASASPPEAVLDLFVNAMAKAGHVGVQTPMKIGADIARRFEVEMNDGQTVATMLVVTDGTRVYQLLCVTLKGKEHSTNVTHFINSFALVQL
jgi:hypothetical protein